MATKVVEILQSLAAMRIMAELYELEHNLGPAEPVRDEKVDEVLDRPINAVSLIVTIPPGSIGEDEDTQGLDATVPASSQARPGTFQAGIDMVLYQLTETVLHATRILDEVVLLQSGDEGTGSGAFHGLLGGT